MQVLGHWLSCSLLNIKPSTQTRKKNKWTERGKKKKKKWPIKWEMSTVQRTLFKSGKDLCNPMFVCWGQGPRIREGLGSPLFTSAPQMADLKTGQGLEWHFSKALNPSTGTSAHLLQCLPLGDKAELKTQVWAGVWGPSAWNGGWTTQGQPWTSWTISATFWTKIWQPQVLPRRMPMSRHLHHSLSTSQSVYTIAGLYHCLFTTYPLYTTAGLNYSWTTPQSVYSTATLHPSLPFCLVLQSLQMKTNPSYP